MAYHVDVGNTALYDAQDAFAWMEEHSPIHAADWYNGLIEAIFSLDEMPRRCALAPESDLSKRPLRQLLYTRRKVTYRILFAILQEEDEENEGALRIYRIRHGAQRPLTAAEIRRGETD